MPTRFVLSTEDRTFPPDFMRRLAADRLGIVADEIPGSHCVALSRPKAVADLLVGYAASAAQPPHPSGRCGQRAAQRGS